MLKIAKSVHTTGLFDETHLLGVRTGGLTETEHCDVGVSIVRLRGSARRGSFGQILRAAFWQPRVYLRYRTRPVAVIAAHNIWVLPLCWRLSRKTGASLVYNAHELETETGSMTGFKQRIAKYIESHLVTKCSVVSVVNGSIADWYECEYRIRRPVVVDNIPVIRDAEVRLREHLGITPEEMLYIHTGHLVEGRNIPLILSAFSGRPEHVVFLGDGYLRDAVLAAAAASPNIHWVAPVSPDLVVAHVREADVGLCLIEDQRDLSDKLSSPNKLLEPLAAGVPPLCSDLVEARRRLGSLADDWILRVPSIEIESALDRIGKADVEKFRSQWPGMRQWTSEVEPLLAAYRQLAHPALPGRHTPHTYG